MKLLFAIQAYGRETFGGSESYARMMATNLVARGHSVDVITSCATTYFDWANYYEPGTEDIDGVTVHRIAVDAPRDHDRFGALIPRLAAGPRVVPLYMQRRWLDMQGPLLPGYEDWLWDHALEYDAISFFTYLYSPTVAGLPVTSGRVPTILHPLSHDEWPFYLPMFDTTFKLPTGYVYLTEEDAHLMRSRANPSAATATIGIGVEQDAPGDPSRFRAAFDLGDDPYLLYVGRLDPIKGVDELTAYFEEYKRRRPGPLKLMLMGERVRELEDREDVLTTGFVTSELKYDGLAGAMASVHPSYFESFSITLTEAWAQRTPALVNARCPVLNGQARRSGGGLTYASYAEFEVAVDMLANEEPTRKLLADNGRSYIETHYEWGDVMQRYERFVARVPAV